MLCFFFFKQKTAYEMRISDWSSDVCSSDLRDDGLFYRLLPERKGRLAAGGRFQVLAFSERERGRDARNWGDDYPFASGAWRRVRWIDLPGADSATDDLRARGHEAGGVRFARGAGIHWGKGELYFTAPRSDERRGGTECVSTCIYRWESVP